VGFERHTYLFLSAYKPLFDRNMEKTVIIYIPKKKKIFVTSNNYEDVDFKSHNLIYK